MLFIQDNILMCKCADRAVALDSFDYASLYGRLVHYGFRPAFAAVLAARPIVDMGELLEFAVEFGLVER